MKYRRVIGIDPGASGGLAFICDDGRMVVHGYKSTPPLYACEDAVAGIDPKDAVCYIEKVGGFIGKQQPGSHMFKFGKNAGIWEGIMLALHVRVILVCPQEWQSGIPGVAGKKDAERKRALRDEAIRRFPTMKPTLETCDAMLIADYANSNEGR